MSLPSNQTELSFTANDTAIPIGTNTSTQSPPTPLSSRVSLYDIENTTHSIDEVLEIGRRLQNEYYNFTQAQNTSYPISPSNHTGNWKTALLYNLAQLINQVFPTTIVPAKIVKPTIIPPQGNSTENATSAVEVSPAPKRPYPITRDLQTDSQEPLPEATTVTTPMKETVSTPRTVKRRSVELRRKRRGAPDNKEAKPFSDPSTYDLTTKNFLERLQLTSEQIKENQASVNNLRKAIGRYNALKEKNSREGQALLVKQSESLANIQRRLKQPEHAPSKQMIDKIKVEFNSHKVWVNQHLHGVWVAGAPAEDTATYMKVFLQAYEGFDFYFWVDKKAYGAAKFTSILKKIAFDSAVKELRGETSKETVDFLKYYDDLKNKYEKTKNFEEKQKYSEDLLALYDKHQKMAKEVRVKFDSLFLENMIVAQDGFFNYCLVKGIDSIDDNARREYLEKYLKLPADEVAAYKKTVQDNEQKIKNIVDKVNKELGSARAQIVDISSLESMKDTLNTYNYETEMLLRWNYPAATDQLRMYMLKEHGGIYLDLDMMPAYSDAVNKKINEVGGTKFFEELKLRRAISGAVLKLAADKAEKVDVEAVLKELKMTDITVQDKESLKKVVSGIESLSKSGEKLFQKMASSTVRDFMPILQRYHKWATQWNVRGLNGLMMAHKESATVDAVIEGQRRAYADLRALRQNVLSGEYFNRLSDLTHLDYKAEVGGALVKNYLAGSLFSDFRQDSIVAGAVSTLGISGPDLIMKEMVKFFRGLGPIGEDYLNKQKTKLGKPAFLGAYKELTPTAAGGPKFDWLNPISVGVNDVTPADESTWCGIKPRCFGELLFSDESKLRPETPKRMVRTQVSFEEFTKLWSAESKSKLPRQLLDFFNLLIESSDADVTKLSELDRRIEQVALQVKDDVPAKEAVFSLQWQVAELIRSVQYPVANQVHLFPFLHEYFEADLEKAIKLYLKSHTQTNIVLWHSPISEMAMFLKDMQGIVERTEAVSKLLSEGHISDTEKWQPLLDSYAKYKAREVAGLLTEEEFIEYVETSTKLNENAEIQSRLAAIEEKILAGYGFRAQEEYLNRVWSAKDAEVKKKVLALANDLSRDRNNQGNSDQHKWLEEVYDAIHKKRITEPAERIKELVQKYKESSRVFLQDIDSSLSENPLFLRMQREGYAFRDWNAITRFLLADVGVSGVLSEGSIFPAPSKELVDLLKKHSETGDGYLDLHDKTSKVYSWLADAESAEGKEAFETLPKGLQDALKQHESHNLLVPPVDASVTALGMQYGLEAGKESERVMTSVSSGIFNPASTIMHRYVSALYELHRHIQEGTLTKEFAKTWLESQGAACFVSEAGLERLVKHSESKSYLSLTEVHRTLTGLTHLGQGTAYLLSGAFPGASKIITREGVFGRPLATTMLESPAVLPYDYGGVGSRNDLFAVPRNVPTTNEVIETAKYSLVGWPEFYHLHAAAWEELAVGFGAGSIELHPQTFIYETEGRCMGLSMMYMLAGSAETYARYQENVSMLSAIFQTKERDKLPIAKGDERLLNRGLGLIDWLQYHGNKKLLAGGILSKKEWSVSNIGEAFFRSKSKSGLVTTPTHTLVLHSLPSCYRVTDPNFGHIDFPTLENAVLFIEAMVQVSDDIRNRYGFSPDKPVDQQLGFYIAESQEARNAWHSATDAGFSSYIPPTLERMILRGEVTIQGVNVPWRALFEMGGMVDHARINEHTQPEDLDRMKLHGDLLQDYLAKNVLDPNQVELIQSLLETRGVEVGTPDVSPDLVMHTPSEIDYALKLANANFSELRDTVKSTLREIYDELNRKGLNEWEKIKILETEVGESGINFKVLNAWGHERFLRVRMPGIMDAFRRFGPMLNEVATTGVLDFDLTMVVVALVQYARMVEHGLEGEPLTVVSVGLGVKQAAELTLGAAIQALGGHYLTESGIQNFRLETELARKLASVAERVGGPLGGVVQGVSRVLEFPILETVVGVWSLIDGITLLQKAETYSDKAALRVRVAFDTLTLSLTVSSVVAPATMLAIGPVAAIGMGMTSIARNVARKEERHREWLKYEQFLTLGSQRPIRAYPQQGVLNCSENRTIGRFVIDLRTNPPTIQGKLSHSADHKLGYKPGWTDAQVRQALGYAYPYTPHYALAQGHANTCWPKKLPTVPKGKYRTVVLGYGRTYVATAEVVYLSNQVVWRSAVMDPAEKRYYIRPLQEEKLSDSSTVIGGNEHVTVHVMNVLGGDLDYQIRDALSYKNYHIKVKGGPGGVTVHVGNAGYYELFGDPKAENILSFESLSRHFGVHFDLTQLVQEVYFVRPDGVKIDLLRVEQRGFRTIIGSPLGVDVLKGSSNTKFKLGAGGGTVYSGLGFCRYYVPKVIRDLHIKIAAKSDSHILFLETDLSDWKPMNDRIGFIPVVPPRYVSNSIFIENEDGTPLYQEWHGRFEVKFKDGITLNTIDTDPTTIPRKKTPLILAVTRCEQSLWKKRHPKESEHAADIISWLQRLGWALAPEVLIAQKESTVLFHKQNRSFTYLPHAYTEIDIKTLEEYAIRVQGVPGCTYIITSSPGSRPRPIELLLAHDDVFPQIVDITTLVPSLILGKLVGDKLELAISSPRYTVLLNVSWDLKNFPEQTIFDIHPRARPTLGEWVQSLKKASKGESHALYHHSELIPERLTGIMSLNNTVTLILGGFRKNNENILGVENRGNVDISVVGNVDEGALDRVMADSRWHTYSPAKKNFEESIPARSMKYLAFKDLHWFRYNTLMHSVLKVAPLHAKDTPTSRFSHHTWQAHDEIQVYKTSLELDDFTRYTIAEETPALSRQLMYAQELVAIQNRDFIVKLFYVREEQGIGAIRLVFKDFFQKNIDRKTLQSEASSQSEALSDEHTVSANTHQRLIDESYWNHLKLKLGDETLDLAMLAREFGSSWHRQPLEQEVKNYHLKLPAKYQKEALVVLTHTIDPKEVKEDRIDNTLSFLDSSMKIADYRLPLSTIPQSSYYLDPVSGDLYVVRLIDTEKHNQAFVLRLKGYKHNWGAFQKIGISEESEKDKAFIRGKVLAFVGPDLRHFRVIFPAMNGGKTLPGKILSLANAVIPTNDQVLFYDPNTTPEFYSWIDYLAWDLRDRVIGSKRAKAYDNYLLEAALHLNEAHPRWAIPKEILHFGAGYYRVQVPKWIRSRIRVGMLLKMSSHNIVLSFITSQKEVFDRRPGSKYDVYYSVIENYATLQNHEGDMTCDFEKRMIFRVRKIDESEYYKKKIYIVMEVSKEEELKLRMDNNVITIPGEEIP